MTQVVTGVLGADAADPVDPVDAEALLARLRSVVHDLARAPADRDPALWAAHEFTRCAQMLLGARSRGAEAAADLQPILDHARSAMVSLTMARRASGGSDTIDTSSRPVNGAPYRA